MQVSVKTPAHDELDAARPMDGDGAYRADIDGLRALAVLSVVLYHFSAELLPSGFLGVDVFFVISGYVITSSLGTRSDASLGDLLLAFYARRVKRLVPALALCVVVTGLAICLFDPHPAASLHTGVAALFGLSNLYLLDQATDYFAAGVRANVFAQTWSLGVEEQFYLVFPLLVWVTGLARGAGRYRGGTGPALWTLGATVAASLSLFLLVGRDHATAAFYLMPTRFWELGAGALACTLTVAGSGTPRRAVRALPPVVALVILVAVMFAPATMQASSTIIAVLLIMVLVGAASPATPVARLLSLAPVVYVGRISYSLYLWHWSVLSLSRWSVGIHPGTVWWQAALIVVLAAGSYRYVEQPLRRATWSRTRGVSILLGVTAAGVSAALLLLLSGPLAGRFLLGTSANAVEPAHPLTEPYRLRGIAPGWEGEPCVLSSSRQTAKKISSASCTLGAIGAGVHRVLVVGNSYAAAMVRSFDPLVLSDHYAVTIAASWGSAPLPEVANTSNWRDTNRHFWDDEVPGLIRDLREGDVVFLVSDLSELSPAEPTEAGAQARTQLGLGLARMSAELGERGISLAILDGTPFVREAACEPPSIDWSDAPDGACRFLSRAATLARRASLDAVLRPLERDGRLIVVDLMDVLCPGATCTGRGRQGERLYRDRGGHPSIAAAQMSAPAIRAALAAGHASRASRQAPVRPVRYPDAADVIHGPGESP